MSRYKVQCDKSGQMFYAHETTMEKTLDGGYIRVAKKYRDPQHPQSIAPKPARDVQSVPNPRPRNHIDYSRPASTEYLNTMAGINISGLDFGIDVAVTPPGTLGINYFDIPNENIDYWTTRLKVPYIRIPFRAERMFAAVDGDIDDDYYQLIKRVVDRVLDAGAIPIIDMHNNSKFQIGNTLYEIGSAQYTTAHFIEHWRKLATSSGFGYDARIEFDLMNEPTMTILTDAQWMTTLNSAIAGIRGEGANNLIHIEIGAASGTPFVFNLARAVTLEDLTDSADNWLLHLHGYFDNNLDGGGDLTANSDIDFIRYYPVVRDFVYDLRRTTHPNLQMHHGEFGAGLNTGGYLAHQNFHQFSYENKAIMRSWTMWGGGASWPLTYALKSDPVPVDGGEFREPTKRILESNAQIKQRTGAKIDYDLTDTSKTFSCLSISRNSTGYALTKAGVWQNFAIDTLRQTDRGVLVEDTATNLVARDLIGTGTDVNVTTASGQADFTGGSNGFTITEAGSGTVAHYNSIDTSSYLSPDTDYVVQYLVDFRSDWWTFIHSNTPNVNSVYNYYRRARDVKSGQWKTNFLRISRDSGTSIIRSRVGFQPDATPASADVPDSYEVTGSPRVMGVCCPMITEGTRVQSPIFSSSANAVRYKDDISFTGDALRCMQGDAFTIIIEVGELDYRAEASNILKINSTIALRRNADHSVGGDVISTLATDTAFNGVDSFFYPRRVALSYKAVTESVLTPQVVIAGEGLGDPVTATGSFGAITSVNIEPFGGYLRKIRIYNRFVQGQELINLMEHF